MTLLKMKDTTYLEYAKERNSLSSSAVEGMLLRGEKLLAQTPLVNTLVHGGSVFFPHASIMECGDQVAAAALASLLACKESGKNQILALGVLHGFVEPLYSLVKDMRMGRDLLKNPHRRIYGPGLPLQENLSGEFSLDNFHFLLRDAAQFLHMEMPSVISRYIPLVNGEPKSIPEIGDLQKLAKESIIIATADPMHHGIAYGTPPEKCLPISPAAYELASRIIDGALSFLSGDDLDAFQKYCWDNRSDADNVGQILRFLLGPLKGVIHDLKLINVEKLYPENCHPSWVAAALIELMPLLGDPE
ncbi:MAG: hypothetical protein JSR58_05020 [Verrucomicrobia bacterium]|nr:hypothetical protein [Verrucomicrobiota bacterium]